MLVFLPAGALDDDSDDLPPLVAFDDPVGLPPPRGSLADSGRLDDEADTLPPLTAGTGIACCALGTGGQVADEATRSHTNPRPFQLELPRNLTGEKMYKSISGGGAVESSRAQVEYSAFEKWFHPSKSTPTA